jgi:hypothetical protein
VGTKESILNIGETCEIPLRKFEKLYHLAKGSEVVLIIEVGITNACYIK